MGDCVSRPIARRHLKERRPRTFGLLATEQSVIQVREGLARLMYLRSQGGHAHRGRAIISEVTDPSPPWVDPIVAIGYRYLEPGTTILGLFQDAGPDLSERTSFEDALTRRLSEEPALVESWQAYSWDKRTSSGPYLEGLEVGFFDGDRRDVTQHTNELSACADFVYREACSVLQRRNPGARSTS